MCFFFFFVYGLRSFSFLEIPLPFLLATDGALQKAFLPISSYPTLPLLFLPFLFLPFASGSSDVHTKFPFPFLLQLPQSGLYIDADEWMSDMIERMASEQRENGVWYLYQIRSCVPDPLPPQSILLSRCMRDSRDSGIPFQTRVSKEEYRISNIEYRISRYQIRVHSYLTSPW